MNRSKIAFLSLCCALSILLCGCASSEYKKAVSLFEKGEYESAGEIFKSLGTYKDSADYLADIPYQEALAMLNQGDYSNAERAFAILDDYKDSPKMVKECRYCYGKALIEAEDYGEAVRIFTELGDYKDSSYIIDDIANAKSYSEALYHYKAGYYNDAILEFVSLGEYKDSEEIVRQIKQKKADENNSLPYYITDMANLLTPEQLDELESIATTESLIYGCGIYVITVNDYKELAPNIDEIRSFSESFYSQNNLGEGVNHNGTLLMLSIADRDYALISYGSTAHRAFTDYGKELLCSVFLDNLGQNDWYGGFSDYLKGSGSLLGQAAAGNPVDVGFSGSIV